MVRGNPTPKGLQQRLYELALQQGSWTTRQAAALLGAAEEEIEEAADSLESVGLLRPAPRKSSGYAVVAPEVALSRLFTQEGHQIARHQEQLAHTREAMISIARDYLACDRPRAVRWPSKRFPPPSTRSPSWTARPTWRGRRSG